MRVKAIIEYDGSKFSGFQIQKHTANTIIQAINDAISSLGIKSKVIGSGRTDKGVHAINQVIHFDIPKFWQEKGLLELKTRLNHKLKFIRFKYIKEVSIDFHAQYSAKTRVYRYLIKTKEPKVFEKDYISFYKIKNINKLSKALKLFEGKHNFKYFKKEGSITSSDIREVYKTKIVKKGDYIAIYFFANGYLRSQVRLMVAAILAYENGKISKEDIKKQLMLKCKYISKPASANGLYLANVFY